MNQQSVSNLIQALSSIAVLIGLVLVIWELQQSREIARVEQQTAGYVLFEDGVKSLMGEHAAAALAKACEFPGDLTIEDMIVLDQAFIVIVGRMRSLLRAKNVSEEFTPVDWRAWQGNFSAIFSTEYGRWWWTRVDWEPEIMEAGNRYLENVEIVPCATYYDGYRRSFNDA